MYGNKITYKEKIVFDNSYHLYNPEQRYLSYSKDGENSSWVMGLDNITYPNLSLACALFYRQVEISKYGIIKVCPEGYPHLCYAYYDKEEDVAFELTTYNEEFIIDSINVFLDYTGLRNRYKEIEFIDNNGITQMKLKVLDGINVKSMVYDDIRDYNDNDIDGIDRIDLLSQVKSLLSKLLITDSRLSRVVIKPSATKYNLCGYFGVLVGKNNKPGLEIQLI